MFRIVGLKLLSSTRHTAITTSFFDNLGFHGDILMSFKFFSVLADKGSLGAFGDGRKHCFTVSFLIDSCGMPIETALNVASKVNFRTPKRPDLVLLFLRSQGFNEFQISNLVRDSPRLLFCKSDRTLLPKFEFLHSIGLSKSECVQFVCTTPRLLEFNLKNCLIPTYNYLKSVLVANVKVIKCLKRSPRVFRRDLQGRIAPNISLLRTSGVSEASISFLVSSFPSTALLEHSKFCSIVSQVMDMGFNPSKHVFVDAIKVLSTMTSLTRERKFEAYRKCGWSKDQTVTAFKKFPTCLSISEENIFKTMDFFVNKMGLKPEDIAKTPCLIIYSLEKRIIPRCSVVQSLRRKGLLKKESSIASVIYPAEEAFLDKYVTKFPKDVVASLLKLYTGEVKVFDV